MDTGSEQTESLVLSFVLWFVCRLFVVGKIVLPRKFALSFFSKLLFVLD